MNIHNKKHVVLYLLIGSIVCYLLSVSLSAIFIVALPMDKDWCKDTIELRSSDDEIRIECVKFKNDLEEAKYRHNVDMQTGNEYLYVFKFIITLVPTLMLFYFIPKWKGAAVEGDDVTKSIIMSAALTFIAPFILSFLLPAPYKWFPQVFNDIHEAQIESKMRELKGR